MQMEDKKSQVAIPISDKKHCTTKAVVRDKEGHYIIMKGQSTRAYDPSEHLCTQRRSTSICKANLYTSKDTLKQIKMNITTQNLWDTVKAVLRGKFIALQAYIKKQEKEQINNPTLQLKELKKAQQSQKGVKERK